MISSAIAALHVHKRFPKKREASERQAEAYLLQALAKDDLFFPAYLSLAALYLYRMKLPEKALKVLEEAKDRGPLRQLEPMIQDAEAMKAGGNDHMIQGLFQEHDYLTVNEYWQGPIPHK